MMRTVVLAVVLLVTACAGQPETHVAHNKAKPSVSRPSSPAAAAPSRQLAAIPRTGIPDTSVFARPSTRIVKPPRPLQCVPYARKVSGIDIRGDAWTWWRSAKGHYRTGRQPKVGSVLAFKRTKRLRLGHLSVVTAILNSREILVDQANWLNRGQIQISTPVRDVSKNNDWSAVRVWYIPGDTYGSRTYTTRGFIYPERLKAAKN
jgi:surface antigen